MTTSKNNHNETRNQKKSRKKVIVAIVIFIIIAILIFSIYMLFQKNNGKSQIEDLENNIKSNNAQALSEQLSTKERNMSATEAKHLIDYLQNAKRYQKFEKEIKKIKTSIKSDNSESDLGQITDDHNDKIINVSKNGKKFFLIDKISMEPHYRDVYIKELDNSAVYHISKNNNVPSQANHINRLGTFIVGNYDVSLTKEFDKDPVKGKIKGYVHINTNKKDMNNHIVAQQDFKQTKIKIKLHNHKEVKDKSIKLYINNKPVKYKKDKTYGYFPNEDNFDVYASGKYKDHILKTNKVSVMESLDDNTQTVNLEFDENKIKKLEKDKNKAKDQLEEFIKSYMDKLNKAYKKTDYQPIEEYIKTNSQAEDYMKPKFNDKQDIKYTDTQVNSVKDKGDEYLVKIQKKFKSNTVKTDYYIEKKDGVYKINKIVDQT